MIGDSALATVARASMEQSAARQLAAVHLREASEMVVKHRVIITWVVLRVVLDGCNSERWKNTEMPGQFILCGKFTE